MLIFSRIFYLIVLLMLVYVLSQNSEVQQKTEAISKVVVNIAEEVDKYQHDDSDVPVSYKVMDYLDSIGAQEWFEVIEDNSSLINLPIQSTNIREGNLSKRAARCGDILTVNYDFQSKEYTEEKNEDIDVNIRGKSTHTDVVFDIDNLKNMQAYGLYNSLIGMREGAQSEVKLVVDGNSVGANINSLDKASLQQIIAKFDLLSINNLSDNINYEEQVIIHIDNAGFGLFKTVCGSIVVLDYQIIYNNKVIDSKQNLKIKIGKAHNPILFNIGMIGMYIGEVRTLTTPVNALLSALPNNKIAELIPMDEIKKHISGGTKSIDVKVSLTNIISEQKIN